MSTFGFPVPDPDLRSALNRSEDSLAVLVAEAYRTGGCVSKDGITVWPGFYPPPEY